MERQKTRPERTVGRGRGRRHGEREEDPHKGNQPVEFPEATDRGGTAGTKTMTSSSVSEGTRAQLLRDYWLNYKPQPPSRPRTTTAAAINHSRLGKVRSPGPHGRLLEIDGKMYRLSRDPRSRCLLISSFASAVSPQCSGLDSEETTVSECTEHPVGVVTPERGEPFFWQGNVLFESPLLSSTPSRPDSSVADGILPWDAKRRGSPSFTDRRSRSLQAPTVSPDPGDSLYLSGPRRPFRAAAGDRVSRQALHSEAQGGQLEGERNLEPSVVRLRSGRRHPRLNDSLDLKHEALIAGNADVDKNYADVEGLNAEKADVDGLNVDSADEEGLCTKSAGVEGLNVDDTNMAALNVGKGGDEEKAVLSILNQIASHAGDQSLGVGELGQMLEESDSRDSRVERWLQAHYGRFTNDRFTASSADTDASFHCPQTADTDVEEFRLKSRGKSLSLSGSEDGVEAAGRGEMWWWDYNVEYPPAFSRSMSVPQRPGAHCRRNPRESPPGLQRLNAPTTSTTISMDFGSSPETLNQGRRRWVPDRTTAKDEDVVKRPTSPFPNENLLRNSALSSACGGPIPGRTKPAEIYKRNRSTGVRFPSIQEKAGRELRCLEGRNISLPPLFRGKGATSKPALKSETKARVDPKGKSGGKRHPPTVTAIPLRGGDEVCGGEKPTVLPSFPPLKGASLRMSFPQRSLLHPCNDTPERWPLRNQAFHLQPVHCPAKKCYNRSLARGGHECEKSSRVLPVQELQEEGAAEESAGGFTRSVELDREESRSDEASEFEEGRMPWEIPLQGTREKRPYGHAFAGSDASRYLFPPFNPGKTRHDNHLKNATDLMPNSYALAKIKEKAEKNDNPSRTGISNREKLHPIDVEDSWETLPSIPSAGHGQLDSPISSPRPVPSGAGSLRRKSSNTECRRFLKPQEKSSQSPREPHNSVPLNVSKVGLSFSDDSDESGADAESKRRVPEPPLLHANSFPARRFEKVNGRMLYLQSVRRAARNMWEAQHISHVFRTHRNASYNGKTVKLETSDKKTDDAQETAQRPTGALADHAVRQQDGLTREAVIPAPEFRKSLTLPCSAPPASPEEQASAHPPLRKGQAVHTFGAVYWESETAEVASFDPDAMQFEDPTVFWVYAPSTPVDDRGTPTPDPVMFWDGGIPIAPPDSLPLQAGRESEIEGPLEAGGETEAEPPLQAGRESETDLDIKSVCRAQSNSLQPAGLSARESSDSEEESSCGEESSISLVPQVSVAEDSIREMPVVVKSPLQESLRRENCVFPNELDKPLPTPSSGEAATSGRDSTGPVTTCNTGVPVRRKVSGPQTLETIPEHPEDCSDGVEVPKLVLEKALSFRCPAEGQSSLLTITMSRRTLWLPVTLAPDGYSLVTSRLARSCVRSAFKLEKINKVHLLLQALRTAPATTSAGVCSWWEPLRRMTRYRPVYRMIQNHHCLDVKGPLLMKRVRQYRTRMCRKSVFRRRHQDLR